MFVNKDMSNFTRRYFLLEVYFIKTSTILVLVDVVYEGHHDPHKFRMSTLTQLTYKEEFRLLCWKGSKIGITFDLRRGL